MCGITARVGTDDVVTSLVRSLENLEYRGYDSAGIAVQNGKRISIAKHEGEVSDLKSHIADDPPTGNLGIGHTRWSTHGSPTDANAHPHTSCNGEVAVVHNGIIENYTRIKADLEARGHEFESETDTEVVPHLVEEGLEAGADPESAFKTAIQDLEGSFALAMIVEGEASVYATKNGSPLVLGEGEDATFLASDVPAFLEFTNRVQYLNNGDVAVANSQGYRILDDDGNPVDRPIEVIDWDVEDVKKDGYDHYMLKEIYEQPTATRQTLHGRIENNDISFEELPLGSFADIADIQLVACGTSFHAAMYGDWLFGNAGLQSRTYLASEYLTNSPPVSDNTLLIGVTQSGETADTLEALREGRNRGARVLTVTNVMGSTAAREFEDTLFIRSGPEIGVAATKTFTSQVAILTLLAERLSRDIRGRSTDTYRDRLDALGSLPQHLESVLHNSSAAAIAERYLGDEGHFFIGRGSGYAVALEAALKFKEITYKHAEGFAAGELKHGPLALVTPETPVFVIGTGVNTEKLRSTVREVKTRGAPVIAISPAGDDGIASIADEALPVPQTHPDLVAIEANVQLQLIAYHTAATIDRSIDKPRNLAKSVTVE